MNTSKLQNVKHYLLNLQNNFINEFSKIENSQNITTDSWEKSAQEKLSGNGISISIEGDEIEKGGVNFSYVKGKALPSSASNLRQEFDKKPFQALGVSIVIHPKNPWVPTAHANVRLFSVHNHTEQEDFDNNTWWFGGGFDLTPYYPFDKDIIYWHQQAKKCCQPYGEEVYPLFKKQCDDYFFLKHRNETRGIGGLFFDDLNPQSNWSFSQAFDFIQSVGNTFLESYLTLFHRHYNKPYTEQQREFQLYRRGRYVEFNLLYDRGTIFGLQSGGRTESILMSMPKEARWGYQWQPQPNTPESQLQDYLKPRDWVI
jgi:coproporphyrinogen III oxidase